MSRENVKIVREMYAAFSTLAQTGDVASYVATHWASDGEYDPIEETGTIRGRDELLRWHERWFEAWDEFHPEVDEIIEAGDAVVAAITVHGRGSQSGATITQRFFHVCETSGGKISRMGEYLDRQEALKSVGLQE
jgi:ketosteroid isomerase-like protein